MSRLFNYKGYTFTARIFGDAELEVTSLTDKRVFAEEDAVWTILSDEITDYDSCETIKEANTLLDGIIFWLIEDGIFQEFTPQRGKFFSW
jgi:hypothetical protein